MTTAGSGSGDGVVMFGRGSRGWSAGLNLLRIRCR